MKNCSNTQMIHVPKIMKNKSAHVPCLLRRMTMGEAIREGSERKHDVKKNKVGREETRSDDKGDSKVILCLFSK